MLDTLLSSPLVHGLFQFFRDAAATLPIIVALGLVLGRRGHGAFCLAGAHWLTHLALGRACIGLAGLACQLLHIIVLLHGAGRTAAEFPLWSPLLLPHSLALVCWLAGMCWLGLEWRISGRSVASFCSPVDRYTLADIKAQLWLSALAALCFFGSYVIQTWPFVSLPQGMSLGQAATAIIRDKAHYYFTALAPAGAMAMLSLPVARQKLEGLAPPETWAKAGRWCALWAVVGYIPYWLNSSATCIGYALRGGPSLTGTLLLLLLPLTGAIICWAVMLSLRNPLRHFWLNWLGLSLLLFFFLVRGFLVR